MKTLIQVKQEHINQGSRINPFSCPIARALREKSEFIYGVTQEGVDFVEMESYRIPLPDEAVSFIQAYDNKEAVKPFSFYLEIPSQYLKN